MYVLCFRGRCDLRCKAFPGTSYTYHCLGHRYKIDHIYTWAGPVLIALNPCKALPLYTPEVAAEYKRKCDD